MSNHIRDDFARQALACELLGSPFNARVCRLLGERLNHTSSFGARVLGWQGHPQNDALPLRAVRHPGAQPGGCPRHGGQHK